MEKQLKEGQFKKVEMTKDKYGGSPLKKIVPQMPENLKINLLHNSMA